MISPEKPICSSTPYRLTINALPGNTDSELFVFLCIVRVGETVVVFDLIVILCISLSPHEGAVPVFGIPFSLPATKRK